MGEGLSLRWVLGSSPEQDAFKRSQSEQHGEPQLVTLPPNADLVDRRDSLGTFQK